MSRRCSGQKWKSAKTKSVVSFLEKLVKKKKYSRLNSKKGFSWNLQKKDFEMGPWGPVKRH